MLIMKRISVAIAIALLSACGSSSEEEDNPVIPIGDASAERLLDMSSVAVNDQPAMPANWQQGAVFMEIYVRAYKDSDGDGIGDFAGLTSQLDYIADLGIEGIWLMPVANSSDKDHGYEVMDYRRVERDYGTRAEFDEFIRQAHARGIGVIADYVVNHSSGDNPVFIDSDNNAGGKRDWYLWETNNPRWVNWSGTPSWHQGRYGYYYGVFQSNMPDFNVLNSEVMEFHYNNLRYWLNAGLDGFRFDAVGQLVENGATAFTGQAENAEILYGLQQLVTQDYQNRYMICEDPADTEGTAKADSCGSAFAFGLNYDIMRAVIQGSTDNNLLGRLNNYPLSNMGIVLANHDGFAGDRIMEQVGGNEQQYRLAATTLLTLPGQPFVYYGEEVGMGHTINSAGDWLLRAPMSWTPTGGFTNGTPFRNIANNTSSYNAESQMADSKSLYHHYKRLIVLRKNTPALRYGDLEILHQGEVLAYRRHYQGKNALVVMNYSASAQTVSVPLGAAAASTTLIPLANFGSVNAISTSSGNLGLLLDAGEILIYQY